MTDRGATRLAWSLWGVWGGFALANVLLSATGAVPGNGGEVFLSLALVGCATVGALLASRHRENAIGWILLSIAVAAAVGAVIDGYANSTAVSSGAFGTALAWASGQVDWLWIVLAGIYLPLLFPSGHLPSPRWRIVAWLGAIGVVFLFLGDAFRPGTLDLSHARIENPLGIEGAATATTIATAVGTVLGAGCFVAAAVSILQRFRRAHGEERLQLKWLAYVLAVIATGLVVAAIDAPFSGASTAADVVAGVGWFTMLVAVVFGIPIASGVAIFRYRLYDIDVVINRTLVYAALTAVLAAAYVGGVLLLQLALRPITAQSALAVAASTLAVAALFRPLRGRIQELVDRRFYRHKYDARRTLDAFGARLREEVDLETLRTELGAVVLDTMQPAHVSLWLRATEPPG